MQNQSRLSGKTRIKNQDPPMYNCFVRVKLFFLLLLLNIAFGILFDGSGPIYKSYKLHKMWVTAGGARGRMWIS